MNSLGIVMRSVLRENEEQNEHRGRRIAKKAAIGAGIGAAGLAGVGAYRGAVAAGGFKAPGSAMAALHGAAGHLRHPIMAAKQTARGLADRTMGTSHMSAWAGGKSVRPGFVATGKKNLAAIGGSIRTAGEHTMNAVRNAHSKVANAFLGANILKPNHSAANPANYARPGLMATHGSNIKLGAKVAGGLALAGAAAYGARKLYQSRQKAKECAEQAAREAYAYTYNQVLMEDAGPVGSFGNQVNVNAQPQGESSLKKWGKRAAGAAALVGGAYLGHKALLRNSALYGKGVRALKAGASNLQNGGNIGSSLRTMGHTMSDAGDKTFKARVMQASRKGQAAISASNGGGAAFESAFARYRNLRG